MAIKKTNYVLIHILMISIFCSFYEHYSIKSIHYRYLNQFTQEEFNIVLTKIKNWKAASFDEIPPEVWKTRKFEDLLLQYCNQNTIERCTEGSIFPFPKKGDLGIRKNNQGITLTSVVAKIYNALLFNCIKPQTEKTGPIKDTL